MQDMGEIEVEGSGIGDYGFWLMGLQKASW